MALSPKRRKFVEEYLVDFNATQAAIRSGYSAKTAHSIGWENLRIPEIERAIEQRVSELALGKHEALIRLGEQARAEYSPYVTSYYRLDPFLFAGMPEETRHKYTKDGKINYAEVIKDGNGHLIEQVIGVDVEGMIADGKSHLIKGVKHTPKGINIEFYDAQAALVHVGRHHKLFTDKSEVTGKDGGPIAVKGYALVSPDDWDDDGSS